jgi:hypothetical protein
MTALGTWYCYADCRLRSVPHYAIMLGVIMLSVVMLSVVAPIETCWKTGIKMKQGKMFLLSQSNSVELLTTPLTNKLGCRVYQWYCIVVFLVFEYLSLAPILSLTQYLRVKLQANPYSGNWQTFQGITSMFIIVSSGERASFLVMLLS